MTRRLLFLNGIAVLMVGFHHAGAFTFSAMFEWTDRYLPVSVPNYDLLGSPQYFVVFAIRQLDTFALAAFLFVSGFFVAFMARGKDEELTFQMVLPRIKVLLVPFAIWTMVRYILLLRPPSTVNDILSPYYYLVLLSQYYLLSLIMVPWAKRNWKSLLAVGLAIQIVPEIVRYMRILEMEFTGQQLIITLTPNWLFPRLIFYFTIGILAGIYQDTVKIILAKVRWILLTILLLAAVSMMVEYLAVDNLIGERWLGPAFGSVSQIVYATTFALTFLAFEKTKVPYSKQLADLGSKSLGVYLMNTPVVYVTASLMYYFTPWLLGQTILYMLILTVVGLAAPLLLMSIARRTPIRAAYRFAFG